TGSKCRVTFKLPSEVLAESAALVGDFTEWESDSIPMKRLKDGSFSATVSLETGKEYQYRYLLDETRWENDWAPDAYTPNEFGTDNSIVKI
ncbi:MAG: isoamylase early set domain-containing protein, partial [Chloroflexota bacterium]